MTHGFGMPKPSRMAIRRAGRRGRIIVLTDPDSAGERIRTEVVSIVGPCWHAHLPTTQCTREDGNIGVENAEPESIRSALELARRWKMEPRRTFTFEDLVRAGLDGEAHRQRRYAVGEWLRIGRVRDRPFLERLNHLGVTADELRSALQHHRRPEAADTPGL